MNRISAVSVTANSRNPITKLSGHLVDATSDRTRSLNRPHDAALPASGHRTGTTEKMDTCIVADGVQFNLGRLESAAIRPWSSASRAMLSSSNRA